MHYPPSWSVCKAKNINFQYKINLENLLEVQTKKHQWRKRWFSVIVTMEWFSTIALLKGHNKKIATNSSNNQSITTDLLKSIFLFWMASRNRSGVDIRISQENFDKSALLTSSFFINLIRNFFPFASFLHSLVVWAANSRVGHRITALMPAFDVRWSHWKTSSEKLNK